MTYILTAEGKNQIKNENIIILENVNAIIKIKR